MTDTIKINRKLLERAATLLQDSLHPPAGCDSFDDWTAQGNALAAELRALLTSQPQASAAQSAPAGAVLMPQQCTDRAQHVKYRNGWNSCLSEVARLNRVQSMPENWKPVPVKPTIEMVEAGYEASLGMPDRSGHARAIEMFDAMLAAAPAQPAVQGEFGAAYQGARA